MTFIRTKGGGLNEIGAKEIPLPFTIENVIQLLDELINTSSSSYSHQDFANWAYKATILHIDLFDSGKHVNIELEALALDIDAQWDLYLFNSYQEDELLRLDLSKVKLPQELLKEWRERLTENKL